MLPLMIVRFSKDLHGTDFEVLRAARVRVLFISITPLFPTPPLSFCLGAGP